MRSSREDPAALSGALSDLATDDLCEMGPFELLDRHLVRELVRLEEPDPDIEPTEALAQRLGNLTGSATVMWGTVERDVTESRVTVHVVRQFGGDVWGAADTTVTIEGDIASVRREAVGALWTLSVGAPPGGEPLERLTERPDWSDETILSYGRAVLSVDALDHDEAARGFEEAVTDAPDFSGAAERARVERSLLAVRGAARLPMAEEAARLARSIAQTDALLADAAPRLSGPRLGIGEMLGYDRLGGQYLADFVIRLGGGS